MASLRDLQLAFASAIRTGHAAPFAAHVVADGIPPERRIAIYANNVRENFLSTLEATYPVLVRLGGSDWLRQVGVAYLREHPSRCGNLHFVGEGFPGFLLRELGDTPYAYFSDVARLEWAYQEVLVAAEPSRFEPGGLAAVPAERQAQLQLELSPAARLVDSPYPLLAIWRANRAESAGADAATISLDAGPARLLVLRRSDHVELRELPPGLFALLHALSAHAALGAAIDAAVAADPALDPGTALTRAVELGAITGWRLPGLESTPS